MDTKFDELLDFPTVLNFRVMGVACDELPDLIIAELQKSNREDLIENLFGKSKKSNHSRIKKQLSQKGKNQIEPMTDNIFHMARFGLVKYLNLVNIYLFIINALSQIYFINLHKNNVELAA